MRILAIETVETTGSVALLADERLIAELPLDPQGRSARTLAPGIAQLLADAGWRPGDVELLAVASGPGSFTGLRIGVTTAKMFAYATSCQVIGVSTMTAIASRVPEEIASVSVVVDAQRSEFFVADFSRTSSGSLMGEETTRLVRARAWIDALKSGTIVTGPGLTKWSDQLSAGTIVLDRELWQPTAAAVGRAGWRRFAAGDRVGVTELVPRYFRRTAAEEKEGRKDEG